MRRLAALLRGVLLWRFPTVWAGELAEVTMADEVTVGDATLQLNRNGFEKEDVGQGLRRRALSRVADERRRRSRQRWQGQNEW